MRIRPGRDATSTLGIAAALLCCLLPAASAHAEGGAAAVAKLNAQRAAHGIPAGIVHVPEWSGWCDLHNGYMAQNGITHEEDSSKPGYTEDGDKAGRKSVLAEGTGWGAANPWETAPIHLHQLLAPRLDAMGVADSHGHVCATTLLSRNRPAPAATTVYTYPGNGTVHRTREVAAEGPYTPGELVGIPAGTETGPYLYVSVDGPSFDLFASASIASASLTGPRGPVALKTVDNFTPGLEGYLPPGGELIPISPLATNAGYRASVDLVVGDVPVHHEWTFTTGSVADPPPDGKPDTPVRTPVAARLTLRPTGRKTPRRIEVRLLASAPLVGRRATLRVRRSTWAKARTRSLRLRARQRLWLPRPPVRGRTAMRVAVKPFALAGVRYGKTTLSRSWQRR